MARFIRDNPDKVQYINMKGCKLDLAFKKSIRYNNRES